MSYTKPRTNVSASEVPTDGEQHFSSTSTLRHIQDPTLKQAVINCDDEDEPMVRQNLSEQKIASQPGLGGPKTRFILSGLSVDETKLSALIICLLITMLFGGITYCLSGDISNNLTSIITTLIYAIAGVNITNSVINRFGPNIASNMLVHSNSKKS